MKKLGRKGKKALLIVLIVVVALAVIVGSFNLYFAVVGGKKQTGSAKGYDWTAETPYDAAVTQTLDMGADDFKILVLSDIHLKNKGTFAAFLGVNYLLDWASRSSLDKLVETVAPNLIVVLGDTVLTDRNDIETERFVRMMDSYRTPWACVFGNHDDEGRADKAKLAEVLLTSEYGLFRYGPNDLHGAGNYVLELTRGGKTEYALFFLDSGSSLEFEGKTEGINEKQIAWYEWNMNALAAKNGGGNPKNMAFFHIPLPQYKKIVTFLQGERGEETFSQNSSGAFFESFRDKNGTHIFVGHDHNNNFIASYEGVTLGYATKSSYNCYYKSGMTGGTLLTVSAETNVKEEIKLF